MPKSSNQKLKLFYIVKILEEQTDEFHPIATKDIIAQLEAFGVSAERKSIYDDINQLIDYGYDIITSHSRTNGGYYLASREFEVAECKLLVDAVQASRFITLKKSRELIAKIEHLVSKYDAKQLQRQVYVAERIKTENESIYYSVDAIHRAIQENVQIEFQYLEWTLSKELKPKREGQRYEVSPWALLWQDENYYLAAFDEKAGMMKHYRVDKMGSVKISEKTRGGIEQFKQLDVAEYSKKTFGMFGGEEMMLTLQFANRLAGVVIDRFGKDIDIRKMDEEVFQVRIKVAVSHQFFGWLAGIGCEARIVAPTEIALEYKKYLQEIINI